MELPVYLITGFLESGKTSFILDTLKDKRFIKGQKTLIISCEEGEVEYEEKDLKAAKAVVEYIEDEDDFNEEYLSSLVKKHSPTQIMLEFNGMWSLRNM
ncbi:MAG: GTPase, partial [Oscillospiraceae bacterium]|nr:GTPase [Oscillospiraceae bacterium]